MFFPGQEIGLHGVDETELEMDGHPGDETPRMRGTKVQTLVSGGERFL